MEQSRRGNFVKQYLWMLWPGSKVLLLELARRLGDEITLPGESVSLLADSLAAGANNFYRCKGRYNPATWCHNLFQHYYQGVFSRAALVYGCRAQTANGGYWEVEQVPYLDWRLENPGALEVSWDPEALSAGGPARLCRLLVDAGHYRTWAVEQLLQGFGEEEHVQSW
jgi:hypothetical protein